MGLKSHIVRTKRITKLVYISVPTLMLISGLILNPVTVSYEEANAATGTATAATTSLTLSSSNNSANVAITPKSANGTFAMSSTAGEAQFGVTTNNFTGYELSIVADDDSGNLTNTNGNVEHSIFSIDAPMTKDSFDTTTYNNRWGYKPNKYVANNTVIDNTGDSAVFLPSPTTTGTILDHTTVANSSANNYSIALGVRADYNTYSGSYAKAFKLQVTANPASYTINFNKNTADAVANMPTTQSSASVSATSIALVNNIPERAHYSFLGWCNTTPTTNNGIDSCSGTVYNPNGAGTNLTYGIDQTTANTTTLYAMWKIDTFTLTLTKGSNITNITASPSSTNGVYNYGQTVTLTAYKTTDTTCKSYATPTWSTTAGTLSATSGNSVTITMPASNVTVTATSAESNIPQTITLSKGTGVNGITIDGTKYAGTSASLTCGQHTVTAPAANFNSGYEFSSWAISGSTSLSSTSSATTTMTVNGAGTLTLNGKSSKLFFQNATSAQCGQTMYDNRGTDAYKNIAYTTASINGLCWMTRNLDLPGGTTLTATDSNVSAGCNLGGTNNCTLPASSTSGFSDNTDAYVYNSNSTTCDLNSPCYSYYSYAAATAGTNPSSGEATSDICPKGWRLPTNAELTALRNTYTTGVAFAASPFYGVYTGSYNSNSFVYGGSGGLYWSSTAKNASSAYYLYFNSSNANTTDSSKKYGNSIRCVAN